MLYYIHSLAVSSLDMGDIAVEAGPLCAWTRITDNIGSAYSTEN